MEEIAPNPFTNSLQYRIVDIDAVKAKWAMENRKIRGRREGVKKFVDV